MGGATREVDNVCVVTVLLLALVMAMVASISATLGWVVGCDVTRRRAVELGHAEFVDGRFRWKSENRKDENHDGAGAD